MERRPWRLRLITLGLLMLLPSLSWVNATRLISTSCRYPFGLMETGDAARPPLVLCHTGPRLGADVLLAQLGHPCSGANDARLHLERGEAVKVGRSCRLRRGKLGATQRMTLGVPIDVNQASGEELEALPRIGKALARRILRHRRRWGPFADVEALSGVRGIGPRTVAAIRPYVRCLPPLKNARSRLR